MTTRRSLQEKINIMYGKTLSPKLVFTLCGGMYPYSFTAFLDQRLKVVCTI